MKIVRKATLPQCDWEEIKNTAVKVYVVSPLFGIEIKVSEFVPDGVVAWKDESGEVFVEKLY